MAKLFFVPTPIGNLKDITYRAVEVLNQVDLVLVEDTRVSKKLFDHYKIEANVKLFNKDNEHKQLSAVIDRLVGGADIAMITDAGTPGISDPGFLLVRDCINKNIEVECLPGPVAVIPALIQSGLPSDRFYFEGFLPHKKGRTKRLKYLSLIEETIVFYESPHRIHRLLKQLVEYFGAERKISISRELTKMYEETMRGTLGELENNITGKKIKGEIVVVLEGNNIQN